MFLINILNTFILCACCVSSDILNELLQRENRVLHFWTMRKRRLDQCQQYVVFERSAKQVCARLCGSVSFLLLNWQQAQRYGWANQHIASLDSLQTTGAVGRSLSLWDEWIPFALELNQQLVSVSTQLQLPSCFASLFKYKTCSLCFLCNDTFQKYWKWCKLAALRNNDSRKDIYHYVAP